MHAHVVDSCKIVAEVTDDTPGAEAGVLHCGSVKTQVVALLLCIACWDMCVWATGDVLGLTLL